MRGCLVDTAFQIQDLLRSELRNKLLRNCLDEKSNSVQGHVLFFLKNMGAINK